MKTFKTFDTPKGKLVVCTVVTDDEGIRVIGRALCAPDDTFDEKVGQEIAYIRCLLKLRRMALNRNRAEQRFYEGVVREATISAEARERHAKRIEEQITRLKADLDLKTGKEWK